MLYVIDLQTRQLVYTSCANVPGSELVGVPAFVLLDGDPVGIAVEPAQATGRARLDRAAQAPTDGAMEYRLALHRPGGAQRCHLLVRESIFARDAQHRPTLLLGVALDADQGAPRTQPPAVATQALLQASRRAEADLINLHGLIETQNAVALAALDPDAAMRLITDGVLTHSMADGAAVTLIEDEHFVYQCCSGVASGQEGLRFPTTASPAVQQVLAGRAFVDNAVKEPHKVNAAVAARVHFRSLAVLPLRDGPRTVGSLAGFAARSDAFGPLVLHNLELLANLLTAALKLASEFRAKQQAIAALQTSQIELIAAREQAEASAKVKAAFLANMSHEIRTPLNGVIGIADILLESGLSDTQMHYARVLRQSGNALLTLVSDVLDFSKIEAGKVTVERTPFNLPNLVADSVEILAPRAAEKHLLIETHIAPGVPARVLGDSARIGQVLLNLISNAIKFTDAGRILVEVEPDPEHMTSGTRFCVTDTGIGIAAEAQGDLFMPFVQADSSTARRFGGTGLGLSISKRLVHAMGGDIGLQSQSGAGSRFWFTLPLQVCRDSDGAQADGAKPGTPALTGHVLIADDNTVNQLVAQKMLQSLGLTCQIASNGQQAVHMLAQTHFDLVLMDCEMPEMDGFEATRFIRRKESGTSRHISVIAVTANAMVGARTACMDAGMDDYLSKPLKKHRLASALRRWLH